MIDRISNELMRDDLTSQIRAAIQDAIQVYQKEFFRFNETFTTTFRTITAQRDYSILSDADFPVVVSPNQIFHIAWMYVTVGNIPQEMTRMTPGDLILLSQNVTQSGQPESYAYDNNTIMLYPTPSVGSFGLIVTLSLTTGGTGYLNGVYVGVPLTGGTGSGATADITIVGTIITIATLNAPGLGYTVGDVLSAAAASLGAVVPTVVTGQINSFSLLNPGADYLGGSYPATPLTGGSGTGATGNIFVTDNAENTGGQVSNVQIVNPGQDYVAGDILSAVLPFAPNVIAAGSILSLQTVTAGNGYTNGTTTGVALVGGTGTGATADITVVGGAVATVVINNPGNNNYVIGDILTTPALPGTAGQIGSLTIVNSGESYTVGAHPAAALTGGTGTGATANITVGAGGRVTAMAIVNAGSGYTVGDILSSAVIGPGSGFTAQVFTSGFTTQVTNVGLLGVLGQIASFTLAQGSGYSNGTYLNVPLTGGAGTGATADITIAGGKVVAVSLLNPGQNYVVGNVLSASGIGPGSGFTVTIATIQTGAITQAAGGGLQIQVNGVADSPTIVLGEGTGLTMTVDATEDTTQPYVITIGGQVTAGMPLTDTEADNPWMTTAERLIRSRAKWQIAMHVTRNATIAATMSPDNGETAMALSELRRETNRMVRLGYVRPMEF